MNRFSHVILFTGDVPAMRRFYESLGLAAREQSPHYVEFDTSGATLGIRADARRRGVMLQFATDDLAAWVAQLAGQGEAHEPIAGNPWGRTTSCTDPDGNPIGLWQPARPFGAGAGLALSAAINARDMSRMELFYRATLGFEVVMDSSWWIQLRVGDASLGLHPRMGETHHARPITIGLAVPDLRAWLDEAVARGVAFTAPPADHGGGLYADLEDPDGNPVNLRDAPESEGTPETLEERLAEPYEEDAAPRRAAMRKPIRKGVKATSRVATRPQYRSARPAGRPRRAGRPVAKVAAPRGTGPAGTRRKPKRKHDSKRARAKPAIGRLRKAERRTLKSQKQQVASASKRRPVKRASRARPAKRVATRRGGARR